MSAGGAGGAGSSGSGASGSTPALAGTAAGGQPFGTLWIQDQNGKHGLWWDVL